MEKSWEMQNQNSHTNKPDTISVDFTYCLIWIFFSLIFKDF